MNRYDKNVTSVRSICKILGYRLVGYDPDWSIVVIDEKLPNSRLQLVARQMRGQYDQISDEFMGRIALIMGFDWIFDLNDSELRDLIDQFNFKIKDADTQNKLRLKHIENADTDADKDKIKDLKKESSEYAKEIKEECDEKIKFFESKLQLREKLRVFINSKKEKK